MAFILTDSAQRYFDKDDKDAVEVVKTANISADEMDEYSPFALFYCVGEVCTRNGLTVKNKLFPLTLRLNLSFHNPWVDIQEMLTHSTFRFEQDV